MDAFANLRPAICFDALADASSLKRELIAGLDLMIVRELTSGVYFGDKKITTHADGSRSAYDVQSYTQAEIERVARVAFELAQGARQPGRLRREVQRHGHRAAVARGGDGPARGRIPPTWR